MASRRGRRSQGAFDDGGVSEGGRLLGAPGELPSSGPMDLLPGRARRGVLGPDGRPLPMSRREARRDRPRDTGAIVLRRRRRRRGRRKADDLAYEAPEGPLSVLLSAVSEVVIVVAMALTLALVIKTFLVQAFFIPSGSMENTLQIGDKVLVSKLTPRVMDLQRGDIVVFSDPGGWLEDTTDESSTDQTWLQKSLTFVGLLPQNSGQHLIKRVIGLPGDTVACCDTAGRLTVNGVSIDEKYIYSGNVPSETKFSIAVPEGHLWVMGDHRADSDDSRYQTSNGSDGTVPISDVVGKAFVVVWPLSRFTWLDSGGSTFSAVDDATG